MYYCYPLSKYSKLLQGDGDYELVKDVIFDDYLRKRIKTVWFSRLKSVIGIKI